MARPSRFRLLLALAAVAAGALALPAAPASAQGASVSPSQVLDLAMRGGRAAFSAVREQQVIRQDQVRHARARIAYLGPSDWQIALEAPSKVEGLLFDLRGDRLTTSMPKERLAYASDGPAGSDLIKTPVLGRLTDDPALLQRNYTVTVAPEKDPVALYPCYKLTLEPKAGLGPNQPPGRRVWIAAETGDLMREERYWANDQASYFISRYERYGRTGVTMPALSFPKETNVMKLDGRTDNAFRRYPSVEAARAAGQTVYAPGRLPDGFVLRQVEVLSLYGTDIVLLHYTDGLNGMIVTYRPKPVSFLSLAAGAYALALVDKLGELAFLVPNNYAVVEKGGTMVYALGDLYAANLQATAESVPIPTAAPARR